MGNMTAIIEGLTALEDASSPGDALFPELLPEPLLILALSRGPTMGSVLPGPPMPALLIGPPP